MKQGPTFANQPEKLPARERILETARTLFYRRGVVNVGIDEVIAESGVAKATLYKHFPSKDALILEFMRQGDGRWLAWLRERTEALEPHPAQRIYAVFDVLKEWFALPHFRGCLLTNATVELADPTHQAHILLREHKERVRTYLEELARQAGVKDPGAASRTLLMLVEGATAQARTTREPGAADQAKVLAQALLETTAPNGE